MYFVGMAIHEFKIPTKYLFTLVILHEFHEFKCPRTCPMSSNHKISGPWNQVILQYVTRGKLSDIYYNVLTVLFLHINCSAWVFHSSLVAFKLNIKTKIRQHFQDFICMMLVGNLWSLKLYTFQITHNQSVQLTNAKWIGNVLALTNK